LAASRATATAVQSRVNGVTTDFTEATSITNFNLFVFSRFAVGNNTDARLSFFSFGKALDLAALDTRVSALVTAIGAAI